MNVSCTHARSNIHELHETAALGIAAASFLPLEAKRYSEKPDPCGNAHIITEVLH
ncbi:hypothetical protein Q4566_06190 [Tamlana sp. 2_MG-2023]|uniref:hypothetical protein n=1 Tax=unclassified Tamlana TaxID=2614803 RepID=UPI0026E19C39|nr:MULTISPECIES: hypothetical protein [unclassified Tamlana]MDO6759785.1 hypothetical protein [Tamlana sp. 2_MG-2023]MDO6791408.1 hypothetical protein [Tamlana sp. 1_MG-2023]